MTIAGQSAGARSVAMMLAIPEARALFRRAILQSAPLGISAPSRDEEARWTAMLCDLLGISGPAALLTLPAEMIVAATTAVLKRAARWAQVEPPFAPTYRELRLGSDLFAALSAGAAAGIDVLIGTTREEIGAFFGLDDEMARADDGAVRARLHTLFGDRADAAYAAYARSRPRGRPIDVLEGALTDAYFRTGSLRFAEIQYALGRPAYVYQLDWPSPAYEGRLGACHCLDLPFTFGNPERWSLAPMLRGADPVFVAALARVMRRAWIAFVREGDPNHAELPEWRSYVPERREMMIFDSQVRLAVDLAGPWRALWEGLN
ncbi:MAG: carboxylesterase family protein [Minicystis sp.]